MLNKPCRMALLASGAALAFATPSLAIVNMPVSDNAYITIDGLDWAWAAPCGAVDSCGDIDLSFQSQFGWRLPTAEEFASHPEALDFVFPGANVPLGGSDEWGNEFQAGTPPGDAACAAAFFSTVHTHCDWDDGVDGLWYDPGIPGGQGVPETLVVRFAPIEGPGAVPEPASWALMIAGFGLAGGLLRRRAGSVRFA